MYSTKRVLKKTGNITASQILERVAMSPEEATRVQSQIENSTAKLPQISKEKALCMIVSANLSKSKYEVIRDVAKENGTQIFPSYYQVQLAKLDTYPEKSSITVTENGARVKLQSLLDHTTTRLMQVVDQQVVSSTSLVLISKWGCDGASGQSQYNQTFSNPNSNDSNVFIANLVPIKLFSEANGEIIWINSKPSSTWLCRPILFEFMKESVEATNRVIGDINEEIQSLCRIDERDITVEHKLAMTMVDGKVCNSVSGNKAAMTCYICGAKPSEMNNVSKIAQRNIREDTQV
jgi:hypothetical protein